MAAIKIFANDSLTYSSNVALDSTMSWTANSHCVNLDFNPILTWAANTIATAPTIIETTFDIVPTAETATDIGYITTSLIPIVSTTPNNINYTYTLTAPPTQTQSLFLGSVDPAERILIIQTKFTSNTGSIFNANNIYLHIKNNSI